MESQAVNPYEAPKSAVADAGIAGEKLTLKQIWFSFQGRIPRKVFWLWGLLLAVPMGVIWGICNAISDTLGMIVGVPFYIVFLWVSLAMQAKRWHDRNKSAWWILLGFVPLANIWALIETGFLRGTEGANDHGGDSTGMY